MKLIPDDLDTVHRLRTRGCDEEQTAGTDGVVLDDDGSHPIAGSVRLEIKGCTTHIADVVVRNDDVARRYQRYPLTTVAREGAVLDRHIARPNSIFFAQIYEVAVHVERGDVIENDLRDAEQLEAVLVFLRRD